MNGLLHACEQRVPRFGSQGRIVFAIDPYDLLVLGDDARFFRSHPIVTRYDPVRNHAQRIQFGKQVPPGVVVAHYAEGRGLPVTAVALGWLLCGPGVTAPIIGANSVEQLSESLQAADLRLTEEEITALDRVSRPS